jgi:hypothetical protein
MSGISPQQKKDPRKKRERKKKKERKQKEQGLKRKRGETSYEEARSFKRRRKKMMKFTSYWERFYQKKERRSYFPIVQNLMCGLIHTHTSFAFALPSIPSLFPFLPPFTTPLSINNDYLPYKI